MGAVTILASALVVGGVGPWMPFQMLAAGWVGFGAGCLPPARGRREIALLVLYGVVASYAFGAVMNLWFWPFTAGVTTGVSFVAGAAVSENLGRFAAFHATTSLGWDTGRALAMTAMTLILGRPVLAALRRAAQRAAFGAPVDFAAPDQVGTTSRIESGWWDSSSRSTVPRKSPSTW